MKKTRKRMILLLAAVLCPANLLYFIPQKLHGNPRYPFRQYAEKLTAAVPPASRVFLIANSKVNDYQLFIAYYANELRISMDDIGAFSYRYPEDPKLKEQVLNSMAENDYVYVIHSSASLEEAFADVSTTVATYERQRRRTKQATIKTQSHENH